MTTTVAKNKTLASLVRPKITPKKYDYVIEEGVLKKIINTGDRKELKFPMHVGEVTVSIRLQDSDEIDQTKVVVTIYGGPVPQVHDYNITDDRYAPHMLRCAAYAIDHKSTRISRGDKEYLLGVIAEFKGGDGRGYTSSMNSVRRAANKLREIRRDMRILRTVLNDDPGCVKYLEDEGNLSSDEVVILKLIRNMEDKDQVS